MIDARHDILWPRFSIGTYRHGGDSAEVLTLTDSPPDQKNVQVVLLEPFICCERGKVLNVPRRDIEPHTQQDEL